MKTSEHFEEGRYGRFRNEVMAGGSVTEAPEEEPTAGPLGALIGIVILGLLAWLAFVNVWMFVFVVGILISVFLHETGHFVTARLTGMKATQFFLGFGPRLWSFRRGETEYGVRALPFGAFVRIIGMNNLDDVPPEDEARTYRQQSYPRRMLVITAGSLMHLLIAIVLLFTVFAAKGELADDPGSEVTALTANGPAEEAGIRSGDIILTIDGQDVDGPDDLGTVVRSFQPGDEVVVDVQRGGQTVTVPVVLGENTDQQSPTFGAALLGVGSRTPLGWDEMSLGEAAVSSVTELFPVTWESTKGIVQVLNPVNIFEHLSGESDDLSTRPTTVVGITQVSGEFGDELGFYGILLLLASVNVFVGVFNMFPLLPLDGGHAAVATYERLRERDGRRYFADVSKLMPLAMGVIVVLLFLFMSGLYLDITDPF